MSATAGCVQCTTATPTLLIGLRQKTNPCQAGVTEESVPDLARVQYEIPLIAEQYRILLVLPARKADKRASR